VLAIIVVAALVPAIAFALSPDPPTNLQVTEGVANPVIAELTWNAPAGDPVSYVVYSSTVAAGPYRIAGETATTAFTFTDGFGGVAYFFRVTAINAAGEESTPAQGGPVIAQWMASPHASSEADTRNCMKCHAIHEAEDRQLLRTEIATSSPAQTATCFVCHDGRSAIAANISTGTVDSFALNSGHSIETTVPGDSTTMCSSCHGMHRPTDVTPMLPLQGVDGPGIDWCLECHDSDSWFAGSYPAVEAPDRDAFGYPVAGTWPGGAAYSGPTNAHRLIPETTQTAGDGGEAGRDQGDCLYCHAAHRGPNTYDSLRYAYRPTASSTLASDQADGTYALSCLACHGGVAPSGFTTAPANIKQFVTANDARAGHRVVTPGGLLPVGAPLPCYECHNPHGSTRGNASMISDVLGGGLATTTDQDVRRFCFTCHTTSDTSAGWDSVAATFTVVPAADEVVGLSRTGGALGLPAGSGHAEQDAASCYACHGNDYSAGGNNVHLPSTGGNHVAVASQECVDCHLTGNVTTIHTTAGCDTCHDNAAYPTLPTGKTPECLDCHDGTTVAGGPYSPVDTSHFDAFLHEPSDPATFTADYQTSGAGSLSAFSALGTSGMQILGAIPASGQECRGCHSQLLTSAHSRTSVSGGEVDCVECHVDTTLGSRDAIAADWPTDRCTDCHETGGRTVHESYSTTHTVEPGTCAGTGASCHQYTNLVQLHSASQSGGAPVYSSCYNSDPSDPSSCHNVLDARPFGVDPSGSCGEGTAGCHQEKNPVNHGYEAVSHTGAPSPGSYTIIGNTYGPGPCEDCHAVELGTEHSKASSSSAGVNCPACHPSPQDTLVPSWDKSTCAQGGCHTAGSPAPLHGEIDVEHVATPPSLCSAGTVGCHVSNLALVHSVATTTVAGDVRVSCEVCHAGGVPTTGDCNACHATAWSGHVDPAVHEAQPTSQTITIDGGDFGPVECVDCHTLDVAVGHDSECAVCHPTPNDTLVPSWDKTTCAQGGCHTVGSTAPMHASIDASHAPVPGQTCYAVGCHAATGAQSLAETHRTAAATLGGEPRTSCMVCHWDGTPASRECSSCHADRVDGSHGAASQHVFSAASDYASATVEGCTNSGAGCHGAESTYSDFTAYHAANGCLAGPCHTSPSKAGYEGDKQCVSCHDGNYVGAPDVVALTGAAPNGHYDETTHTASWLDVVVDAGGSAGAACRDCHDPTGASGGDQLFNQHQALPAPYGDTDCAACHNANSAVTDVITTGWEPALCSSCHTPAVLPAMVAHDWSAPAVTATTSEGCLTADCHTNSDLHGLHKDAAGCDLAGCHDFAAQAAKPTGTTCGSAGACHTGALHTYDHNAVASQECVDCHEQTDVSALHSECRTCHDNPSYPSLPTGATPECTDCHNGTVVGTHAYAPPDSSHYDPVVSQHTATLQMGTESGYACTQCHSLEMKPAHAGPTSIDFDLGGYPDKCVACHELAVDGQTFDWGPRCDDCHATRHTQTATSHDASLQTLASPGSTFGSMGALGPGFSDGFESGGTNAWTAADYVPPSGGTSLLLDDTFESGAFATNGWTASSATYVTVNNTQNHTTPSGTYSARIAAQTNNTTARYFYTTLDLSAYSSARGVSYWFRTSGLVTSDRYRVGYSTTGVNGAYTYIQNVVVAGNANIGTWTQITSAALPQNATVTLRFELVPVRNVSTTRYFWIDDIQVTGSNPVVQEAGWHAQNVTKNTGTYAAQAIGSGPSWRYITKTGVDVSGGASARLDYAIGWTTLEAADDVVVQYTTDGGGAWIDAKNYSPASADPVSLAWTPESLAVPTTTNGIRFGFYADSAADDQLYVDDVAISAVVGGASSTAAASCQDNPNGTDCHNVADVAALHAGTAAGCTGCHSDALTQPVLNCQNSSCHPGVNLDEHIATGVGSPAHHESSISSSSVFGPSFAGSWCTGCHDDSIANEHFVLSAYASTPCRICHAKATDSGAPTNVTLVGTLAAIAKPAGTAQCTDCHNTASKQSVHVQRLGQGGVGGTQFSDTWSGHRVYDSMPGSRTSFTNVAGIPAVSWALPLATQWLNAGWQNPAAAVRCSDCHGSTTGAITPHGSSMSVNMQAGFDASFQQGTLYLDNGGLMSNTSNLCAKCHPADLSFTSAHTKNGHQGATIGVCTNCHNKVPHAWGRPRLIGYPADAVTVSTADREPWATDNFIAFTANASMDPGYWAGKTTCSTADFCHPSSAGAPLWP